MPVLPGMAENAAKVVAVTLMVVAGTLRVVAGTLREGSGLARDGGGTPSYTLITPTIRIRIRILPSRPRSLTSI